MIYFIDEMSKLHYGINIYARREWKVSRGFYFVWKWIDGERHALQIRYSVKRHRWHVMHMKTDRKAIKTWEERYGSIDR